MLRASHNVKPRNRKESGRSVTVVISPLHSMTLLTDSVPFLHDALPCIRAAAGSALPEPNLNVRAKRICLKQ